MSELVPRKTFLIGRVREKFIFRARPVNEKFVGDNDDSVTRQINAADFRFKKTF